MFREKFSGGEEQFSPERVGFNEWNNLTLPQRIKNLEKGKDPLVKVIIETLNNIHKIEDQTENLSPLMQIIAEKARRMKERQY